jgi:CheY-like chemotaxis protein
MNGYEATQQIKATTEGQATAVIALTASVFEEERAVILSAGCDDFVRKPFKMNEIFTIMEKHIGVRFIYEDMADLTHTPSDLNADQRFAMLRSQPLAWRQSLQQALVQLDLDRSHQLIDAIQGTHPELAQQMQDAIDQFAFDHLLQLLAEIEPSSDLKSHD